MEIPGLAPALPPGCPWSGWAPPNIKWCEENLCAWITTPANTWSNVAYLIVGWMMWRETQRLGRPALAGFGPASVVLGFCSFAYHASYTLFFQFFDFLGMFLFIFLFITMNLRRAGIATAATQWAWYFGGVGLCSVLVLAGIALQLKYQLLIAVLAGVVLLQEVALSRRPGPPVAYTYLVTAYLSVGAAAACTALDLSRVWCNPADHWIQGHAFWHLFSALGLYLGFRFYTQFDLDTPSSAAESAR